MKRKFFLWVIVLAFGFVAFRPTDELFEITKNFEILSSLFQELNEYYVDEVSTSRSMKAAIDAMLNTLDPYTNYIPEDQIEDYRTQTTGVYGGIGTEIAIKAGRLLVTMPTAGFAADKAGIRIGDEVIQVGDKSVVGFSIEQLSKLLKGQAGSEVVVHIKRYGESKPMVFNIKRENIQISNVPYSGMVNSEIGIIKLTEFTANASKEVKKSLLELKSKGAKHIILDLRGNPGGLLQEAINICNIFIPKGLEVVSTKGKVKAWNRTYHATEAPEDTQIPIAVLINRNSASASEIVSGVIQDYDRGVLIGQRSFGKGLVQATRSLPYNSKLKVTVAKYYIPSGRCIQEIDYANRNSQGKAEKFADSLKAEFKTSKGRKVYDGGGVSPDVELPLQNYSAITKHLLDNGLIFDFATEYRFKNPELPKAREFTVSDQLYRDFVKWLQNRDLKYSNPLEKILQELKSKAEKEKNNGDILAQIAQLEKVIAKSKSEDLNIYQEEIRQRLEEEIVSRYYFKTGLIESSFDDDPELKKAVEILSDKQKYNSILNLN
jgi:carboxyl-terminal processing protease